MSDEEVTIETSDGQILAAEYKDGQLQIVEVTPFEKDRDGSMLPELEDGSDQQPKYMQVLDTSKGLMQLDLLNLTLVRCQDGEESYQLVANAGGADTDPSATVTCVLQSSDTEDNQDSYMVVENESGQGSLVFLKSAPQEPPPVKKVEQPKKGLSPAEILEKAKALQKAKRLDPGFDRLLPTDVDIFTGIRRRRQRAAREEMSLNLDKCCNITTDSCTRLYAALCV